IGGRHKEEVRDIARSAGLAVHDKPDSVEICFVPDGDHAHLIRERRPGSTRSGHIVDRSGQVLAEHDGIEAFTVRQRKGLGFAAGQGRYVREIVPSRNEVVVGQREELLATELWASDVNWLCDPPTKPLDCSAKIRYRHPGAPATVEVLPDESAHV